MLSSPYIPAADFMRRHDPRDLGVYLWSEKVLSNYFCKTCVIFIYIGDGGMPGTVTLEISIIDGKALPMIEGPG